MHLYTYSIHLSFYKYKRNVQVCVYYIICIDNINKYINGRHDLCLQRTVPNLNCLDDMHNIYPLHLFMILLWFLKEKGVERDFRSAKKKNIFSETNESLGTRMYIFI